MNEKLSRILFGIEMAVLAIVPIYALLIMALSLAALLAVFFAMAVLALYGFAQAVLAGTAGDFFVLTGSDALETLRMALLFVVAILGIWALWIFLRLSGGFLASGRKALAGAGGTFLKGAMLAIVPLAYTTWMAFAMEVEIPVALMMSGLTLLAPALHLWLEIRHATRQHTRLTA